MTKKIEKNVIDRIRALNQDRINVHVGPELMEELEQRQAADADKPPMATVVRNLLRKGIEMERLEEETKL